MAARRSMLLLALLASAGCRRSSASTPPPHLDLDTPCLFPVAGESLVDTRISAAQESARARPADPASWVALAQAFVEKANTRATSAPYSQARDALAKALALDGDFVEARELDCYILLYDHRFPDAERCSAALLARVPDDVRGLASLGDAQMEQGKYGAALATYQSMLDRRADEVTLVRAAWMRWLTGDVDGAIELDRLAEEAGSPDRPGALASAMEERGRMFFQKGDLERSRAEYDRALRVAPGFPPALRGRGLVLQALGEIDAAIADLRAADEAAPTLDNLWMLARALERAGRRDQAARAFAELERSGERLDGRQFAVYLATQGRDPERALALLRKEELNRGEDVYTEDAMAWVLYRAGRLDEAGKYAHNALRLGTRDARMLFHAGVIDLDLGRRDEARRELEAALAANPAFDPDQSSQASRLLSQLTH